MTETSPPYGDPQPHRPWCELPQPVKVKFHFGERVGDATRVEYADKPPALFVCTCSRGPAR